ncbi:MAG: DUF4238 domain-containing protein [Ruminococcaceae bacterium]|nr:DUF4238 domain-containing protein [Oscillospiraceae bacterium]
MNSHYVPQFILKGFCNENNQLIYCDFDKSTIYTRNTKSVFSTDGYYPDELEKDLCHRIEYPFANLFHSKIENARDSIDLSSNELFLLRKYLIISCLRYKYDMTENDKSFLRKIPEEYHHLYRVDSIEAVNKIISIENDDELSQYFEHIMEARRFSYNGQTDKSDYNLQILMDAREAYYNDLIFLHSNDKEEFVIPDTSRAMYMVKDPLAKMFFAISLKISEPNHHLTNLIDKLTPRDYTFYPLSKNLALLSVSPFYKELIDISEEYKKYNVKKFSEALGFSDYKIMESFAEKSNENYSFPILSIDDYDIQHFNSLSINQAKHFIACSDLSKIQQSVNFAKDKLDREISFLQTEG